MEKDNVKRGYDAAKSGLGLSDAWGDVYTESKNNIPSSDELDRWLESVSQ